MGQLARLLLVVGGLAGLVRPAIAGDIAGTVTGPSGPLVGLTVAVMDPTGNQVATGTTVAGGQYQISGLAAGLYFVHASVAFANPDGLLGQTYAGVDCTVNCDPRAATEVAVGAGTTPGIDFQLRTGSTIAGTVTAAVGGAGIVVTVQAFDAKGRLMGSAQSTGPGGAYTILGLPPGPYHLSTFSAGARADELYPDIPCGNNQCDVFAGDAVWTGTTDAHFVLALGSSIAGTIRVPGPGPGTPLEGARVEVWKGLERFGIFFSTPANGQYTIGGLPAGDGFRVFARKAGLVAEVFPDAPCPSGGCGIGFTGTAIDIAGAGQAVTGIDLQLAPGHAISGSLAPAGFVATVQVFGGTGLAGEVTAISSYTVPDLPDDSYVVRARMSNRIAELWDDHQCPGACQLFFGDDVVVSGANVGGIDFALASGAHIAGIVRGGPTGDPIPFLAVEVLRVDGVVMSTGFTNPDGTWSSVTEGLLPGNYFVRTRKPPGLGTHRDQIWNGHPCDPGCAPGSGDVVEVVGTLNTAGIDFALPLAALDFFTLPPCRAFDSRLGPALASGVEHPVRLEATCGVPGDAAAVAANVTVTGATGAGNLAIWPHNLASPPTTSVLNFSPGVTRANNAVLTLSRRGLHNVKLRGSLPGGVGTLHVIVDVTGYFAQSTPP
jgi:hypothetical protein